MTKLRACFVVIPRREQKQLKIMLKMFLVLIHSVRLKTVVKYQFTSVPSVVMIQEKYFAFPVTTREKQRTSHFVIGVESRMNVMVTMKLGCVLTV